MKKRTKLLIASITIVGLTAAGTGVALSTNDDDATDRPITGPAYEQATNAALAHLGEGTVTETEIDDEESKYEVEVTKDDGSQVDVQLDKSFNVVSTEADDENDD
jgi:uncharacterized membrane protein YkoI